MGLEIDILNGKTRDPILYLRKPFQLFDAIATFPCSRLRPDYDDFWLCAAQLAGADILLALRGGAHPDAAKRLTLETLPGDICQEDREQTDPQAVLDISRRILHELMRIAEADGPLICAPSY